ncbi:MAG: molybdopterin-dependent oxidoreductase [Oscillospiraceae bacterium]|nr:molybdopterin-dependent oxidoreductase [Oscillospiraceae bacterium]
MCDICTPGPQCGIDAYIRDGRVIKVEGTPGFPGSNGRLCTKGAANRQYIYREDRIRTPMRRIGLKGSDRFEPISWDEAYRQIAAHLNQTKADYGPEAIAFVCGYPKWFRPFLHRLAHSFGSPNYITESSACHQAEVMSYQCIFGCLAQADLRDTKLYVAWGSNAFANMFPLARRLMEFKEQGGKIIVIDPRDTQAAQKLADLYLRPRIGTDGALALGMANVILENRWHDMAFIRRHVHGFQAYQDYVKGFDLKTTERITGVPGKLIYQAAELFARTDPSVISPSNAITHRINGFNNHRAILSLNAIMGRFDRPGTLIPVTETFCHSNGGFRSLEERFIDETRPRTERRAVGFDRFPLWGELVDEGQGMHLTSQILSGEPYPIRAALGFGVNTRMYPDSRRFVRALDQLDFYAAADIFWTESCRHADIVLPVSTSFERSEVKCYSGHLINYTAPVIEPVHDNRPDADIICDLAKALELDDPLLCSGYDRCLQYIMSPAGIQDWEAFRCHDGPVHVPNSRPYQAGSTFAGGLHTPSGKIELYSERVVKYPHLEPLPVYRDSSGPEDPEYPFVMCAGARLPNAIHSRIHDCTWPRSLRSRAAADIAPSDAKALGLSEGDTVRISTRTGSLLAAAHITLQASPGEIYMYHGYQEADVNALIDTELLDPYTGFPAYKQFRCAVQKVEDEA